MSAVFNFTFVPWFRSVAPYIHLHRGKTFVVAIAGTMMTMPGLPKVPAAEAIDVDESGKITSINSIVPTSVTNSVKRVFWREIDEQ